MIARGFNVITKGILKALCSSYDYKFDYKQGRILHVKFLCVSCTDITVILLV